MLKHCFIVFLVSMVPIIELRGAIPYGVGFGLPLWLTYCIAIVGNMLPVPVIYFFARKVLVWEILLVLSGKGRKGRAEAAAKGGARPVLGAAAVRGHPPAGHRRVDGHAGGQSAGHGLQKERPGLHGRRAAGRRHHGRAEPAGRGGVPRRRVTGKKGVYTAGRCTLPSLCFQAW